MSHEVMISASPSFGDVVFAAVVEVTCSCGENLTPTPYGRLSVHGLHKIVDLHLASPLREIAGQVSYDVHVPGSS